MDESRQQCKNDIYKQSTLIESLFSFLPHNHLINPSIHPSRYYLLSIHLGNSDSNKTSQNEHPKTTIQPNPIHPRKQQRKDPLTKSRRDRSRRRTPITQGGGIIGHFFLLSIKIKVKMKMKITLIIILNPNSTLKIKKKENHQESE